MQNSQLTNDRLNHVYQNLKRWADHDAALNSYISGQKIDPIFHDCVVALSELMERRNAEKSVPVSFDILNAAVAEVTGGNQQSWNPNLYKGHQAVPFINYNSLSRIVERFRTTSFGLMDKFEQHVLAAGLLDDNSVTIRECKEVLRHVIEGSKSHLNSIEQPASLVPEEIMPDRDNTYDYVDGWNACRTAMLQAMSRYEGANRLPPPVNGQGQWKQGGK